MSVRQVYVGHPFAPGKGCAGMEMCRDGYASGGANVTAHSLIQAKLERANLSILALRLVITRKRVTNSFRKMRLHETAMNRKTS